MKYAIKGATILNGHKDMEPVTGNAILVNDGRIAGIVSEAEIPADYPIEDMTGKYLIPGLINMHVHIPSGGRPSKKKVNYTALAKLLKLGVARAVVRALCAGMVKQDLLSGTTTIRAVGGVLDFDTKLRDAINSGKKKGPRILAANYAVSVPGGHMTGSVALPAHSKEEAAAMVRELDKTKPDVIKLMITGGVLDAENGNDIPLRMPEEYVKAATEEAHRLGYPVAAHVESTEGMMVALRAGVDTLEHGGHPTPELIEAMKKSSSILVGTLSPAMPFSYKEESKMEYPDAVMESGKKVFRDMVDCVRACVENGIPVGIGMDTGCPYITHYDFWRELWAFCHFLSLSPKEVLHMATENNAALLGIEKETGSVDTGKSADFVLLNENPLTDIKALRTPAHVIFRGEIFRSPKVKRNAEVDAVMDNIFRREEMGA